MVNLLHLADVHLGHQQYGLKQRAIDTELAFQYVLTQAEDAGVEAVLVAGDLFDSRDVRPKTLQRTEEVLEAVDVPIIVSPGNHDENMSSRRDLTWLEYLNNRGLITLLSTDFAGTRATFAPTSIENPRTGGGGFVDIETDDGTVRMFGVQYRGAYMESQIPAVAEGIRATNEAEGEPAGTVVMAHFGIDDVVPDLGATVSYSSLDPITDVADYVALGHIHKCYETGCVHNPGSLEAFDVQEGRWEDEHGYYILDTDDWTAEHHLSKRRPYYTLQFDVSDYRTFGDMRAEFVEQVRAQRSQVETVCNEEIHLTGDGGRREPVVNLRLTGTLLLDHNAFDLDELREITQDELDALTVQPTDNTDRKAVQDILGELDREEAFEEDGTVNTDVLQDRVFTRLAEESRYTEQSEEVAATLTELEEFVTDEGYGAAGAAKFLRERRRELFPDGLSEESEEAATTGGEAE